MASNKPDENIERVLSNASKSFKSSTEKLYKTIEDQNNEIKKLLEKRESAGTEREKEDIDELIKKSQRLIDSSFDSLNTGVANFWDQWSDSEKKEFLARLDNIEKEKDTIDDVIKKLQGEASKSIREVTEEWEESQKSIAERFDQFSESLRNWADTFNLSAIKSSLDESVDSYVKNLREIRSTVGDWFDSNNFSDLTTEAVKELHSYNRSEFSDFSSELIREFSLNTNDSINAYAMEMAASVKAFGGSVSEYSNAIWRDSENGYEGGLIRYINNLASSMSTSDALNVKAIDVVSAINTQIDTLFGAYPKNEKIQKNLLKSVASIESIQSTAANLGVTALSDTFKGWMGKSYTELYDDETFTKFMNYTHIDPFLFQDYIASGNVSDLYTYFYDYLKSSMTGNKMHDQAFLSYIASDMNLSYADLNSLMSLDRDDYLATISAAIQEGSEAYEATDNGLSLAAEQESKTVGAIEELKNDASNFLSPVVDFFAGMDISMSDLASLMIIGSTASKIIGALVGASSGAGVLGKLLGLFGVGAGGSGALGSLLGGLGSAGTVGAGTAAGSSLLGGLTSGVSTLSSSLMSVLSTAGPIVGGVKVAIDAMSGLSKSVEWLGDEDGNTISGKVASLVGGAIGGTSSGLKGALGGAAKGALVGAFAGPVGMAVGGAIGGIVGSVGGEKLSKFIHGTFDFISDAGSALFSKTGSFAKRVGKGIVDIGGSLFSKTGSLAKKIGKGVTGFAEKSWDKITEFGSGVFNTAIDGLDRVSDSLGDLSIDMSLATKNILSGGGQFLKDVGTAIDSVLSGGGEFLKDAGTAVKDVFEGGGQLLKDAGTAISTTITGFGTATKDILIGGGQLVKDTGEAIATTVEGFGTAVSDVVSSVGTAVKDVFEGGGQLLKDAGTAVKDVFAGGGQFLKDAGSAAKDVLIGGGQILKDTGKAIATTVTGFGSAVKDVLTGGGEFVKSTGEAIAVTVEGFGKGASDVITGVGTAINSIFEGGGQFVLDTGQAISVTVDSFSEGAEKVLGGIGDTIATVLAGGGQFLKDASEAGGGLFSTVTEAGGELFSTLASATGGLISKPIDALGGAVSGVVRAFKGTPENSTTLVLDGKLTNDVHDIATYIKQIADKYVYGKEILDNYTKSEEHTYTLGPLSEPEDASINQYAGGSSYISNDGLAFLHEGEIVLNRDQAEMVRKPSDGGVSFSSGLGDNASLADNFDSLMEIVGKNEFVVSLNDKQIELDKLKDFFKELRGFVDIGSDVFDLAYDEMKKSKLGSGSISNPLTSLFKGFFGNTAIGKSLEKMIDGRSSGGSFFSRLGSFLGGSNSSSGMGGTGGYSSGGMGGYSSGGMGGYGSGGMGGMGGSAGNITLSGSGNEDKIFNFVTGKMGLTPAAAAGILGNLKQESGFNPHALGDGGTSYGIVQWHNERWNDLKNFSSSHGLDSTTLEAQLQFMAHELSSGKYPSTWRAIKNAPNTLQGALDVAEAWVRFYEMPNNIDHEVQVRQTNARGYWDIYGNRGTSSYAVGTPWIPNDQVALIHQGEMIVPADSNPMNNVSDSISLGPEPSDNSEMIDVMKWQIHRLESKLDKVITAINNSSGQRSRKSKRDYGSEISDTDLTFSPLRSPSMGVV